MDIIILIAKVSCFLMSKRLQNQSKRNVPEKKKGKKMGKI